MNFFDDFRSGGVASERAQMFVLHDSPSVVDFRMSQVASEAVAGFFACLNNSTDGRLPPLSTVDQYVGLIVRVVHLPHN